MTEKRTQVQKSKKISRELLSKFLLRHVDALSGAIIILLTVDTVAFGCFVKQSKMFSILQSSQLLPHVKKDIATLNS